jgi:hypothetical protein
MVMKKLQVYSDPRDVKSRLAELGLKAEILREALQRGLAAWASCTPNHPTNFAGMYMWGEAVNAVRELLYPEGWTRSDSGNLPMTVDAAKRVSIIVSTGDEFTGKVDLIPSTRSSKGPRTVNVVEGNAQQMTLFDLRSRPDILEQSAEKLTWIFLFYRDRPSNEVRCELSCPVNMNEDGQIDAWAERIILPAIPFGGDKVEIPTDVPQTPNVVVNIKRRSA